MRAFIVHLLLALAARMIRRKPSLQFVIQIDNHTVKATTMTTTIKRDNAPINLTVMFKAADGVVEKPQAVPAWSVSDSSVLAITPAADGMSAVVTLAGVSGTAAVSVTADGATASSEFIVEGLPVVAAEITVQA